MEKDTIEELNNKLKACQEELSSYKAAYNSKIVDTKKEVAYLKEQLEAQSIMLSDAIDYATNLEVELVSLKDQINESDSFKSIQ